MGERERTEGNGGGKEKEKKGILNFESGGKLSEEWERILDFCAAVMGGEGEQHRIDKRDDGKGGEEG